MNIKQFLIAIVAIGVMLSITIAPAFAKPSLGTKCHPDPTTGTIVCRNY